MIPVIFSNSRLQPESLAGGQCKAVPGQSVVFSSHLFHFWCFHLVPFPCLLLLLLPSPLPLPNKRQGKLFFFF